MHLKDFERTPTSILIDGVISTVFLVWGITLL